MAFTILTQTTSGSSASTTPSVTLPTGTITAGDTLLALIRLATGTLGTNPGGWTELARDTSDASDDTTVVIWKKADGTESGTSITWGTGTSAKYVGLSWAIAGAADPSVRAPETSTVAVGTVAAVDPTTCTPTGGAKDYLWLWVGAWDGESATVPPTGNPTNYGSNIIGNTSGTAGVSTTNVQASSASRLLNAASEDAPSWTCSSAPSQGWTAWTVAVHPATIPLAPAPMPLPKRYMMTGR